jgi:hypothetical protein
MASGKDAAIRAAREQAQKALDKTIFHNEMERRRSASRRGNGEIKRQALKESTGQRDRAQEAKQKLDSNPNLSVSEIQGIQHAGTVLDQTLQQKRRSNSHAGSKSAGIDSEGLRERGNAQIQKSNQAERERLQNFTKTSSTLGTDHRVTKNQVKGKAPLAQPWELGFEYDTRAFGYSSREGLEEDRLKLVEQYNQQLQLRELGLTHDMKTLNDKGLSTLYNQQIINPELLGSLSSKEQPKETPEDVKALYNFLNQYKSTTTPSKSFLKGIVESQGITQSKEGIMLINDITKGRHVNKFKRQSTYTDKKTGDYFNARTNEIIGFGGVRAAFALGLDTYSVEPLTVSRTKGHQIELDAEGKAIQLGINYLDKIDAENRHDVITGGLIGASKEALTGIAFIKNILTQYVEPTKFTGGTPNIAQRDKLDYSNAYAFLGSAAKDLQVKISSAFTLGEQKRKSNEIKPTFVNTALEDPSKISGYASKYGYDSVIGSALFTIYTLGRPTGLTKTGVKNVLSKLSSKVNTGITINPVIVTKGPKVYPSWNRALTIADTKKIKPHFISSETAMKIFNYKKQIQNKLTANQKDVRIFKGNNKNVKLDADYKPSTLTHNRIFSDDTKPFGFDSTKISLEKGKLFKKTGSDTNLWPKSNFEDTVNLKTKIKQPKPKEVELEPFFENTIPIKRLGSTNDKRNIFELTAEKARRSKNNLQISKKLKKKILPKKGLRNRMRKKVKKQIKKQLRKPKNNFKKSPLGQLITKLTAKKVIDPLDGIVLPKGYKIVKGGKSKTKKTTKGSTKKRGTILDGVKIPKGFKQIPKDEKTGKVSTKERNVPRKADLDDLLKDDIAIEKVFDSTKIRLEKGKLFKKTGSDTNLWPKSNFEDTANLKTIVKQTKQKPKLVEEEPFFKQAIPYKRLGSTDGKNSILSSNVKKPTIPRKADLDYLFKDDTAIEKVFSSTKIRLEKGKLFKKTGSDTNLWPKSNFEDTSKLKTILNKKTPKDVELEPFYKQAIPYKRLGSTDGKNSILSSNVKKPTIPRKADLGDLLKDDTAIEKVFDSTKIRIERGITNTKGLKSPPVKIKKPKDVEIEPFFTPIVDYLKLGSTERNNSLWIDRALRKTKPKKNSRKIDYDSMFKDDKKQGGFSKEDFAAQRIAEGKDGLITVLQKKPKAKTRTKLQDIESKNRTPVGVNWNKQLEDKPLPKTGKAPYSLVLLNKKEEKKKSKKQDSKQTLNNLVSQSYLEVEEQLTGPNKTPGRYDARTVTRNLVRQTNRLNNSYKTVSKSKTKNVLIEKTLEGLGSKTSQKEALATKQKEKTRTPKPFIPRPAISLVSPLDQAQPIREILQFKRPPPPKRPLGLIAWGNEKKRNRKGKSKDSDKPFRGNADTHSIMGLYKNFDIVNDEKNIKKYDLLDSKRAKKKHGKTKKDVLGLKKSKKGLI